MKKKSLIFLICILGLLVVLMLLFVVLRFSLGQLAKKQEKIYSGLSYNSSEILTISFECEMPLISKGDMIFDHNDCLEIKKQFEKKYGVLLFPFKLKFSISQNSGSDEHSNSKDLGGTIITFKDWKRGGFDTVVIDNSQYLGMELDHISFYSGYIGFSKYEIYGALLAYPGMGNDDEDRAFLEYICKDAKIITDEYTYNEYIGSQYFKDLLEEFDVQNIDILDGEQREYNRVVIH